MAYHRPGSEKGNQIKDLPEAFYGHLSYFLIYGSGPQIEKGGVQRNGKPGVMKEVRHVTEFAYAETVESKTIQTDLRIYLLFKDNIKILINKHLKGHIDLYFFQYLAHIRHILTLIYNSNPAGIFFTTMPSS